MSHVCVVPNCGREFDTNHGMKVHFNRLHRRDLGPFQSYLAQSGGTTTISSTIQGTATRPMIRLITNILEQAPEHKLSLGDLVQKISDSGIVFKSIGSLAQRVVKTVSSNPDSGVYRPERGWYQIASKPSNKHLDNDSPVDGIDDILNHLPDDVKCKLLEMENRRLQAKVAATVSATQEFVMGLSRLMVIFTTSLAE